VTGTAAFHWPTDGEAPPAKVFDRAPNLAGTQVINYAVSPDGQWLMCVGIKPGPAPGAPVEGAMQVREWSKGEAQGQGAAAALTPRPETTTGCARGLTLIAASFHYRLPHTPAQLYSVEKKVSQPLTAHAGCFHATKLPGRSDTAILFCFVDQKPGAAPKLMIIEVRITVPCGAAQRGRSERGAAACVCAAPFDGLFPGSHAPNRCPFSRPLLPLPRAGRQGPQRARRRVPAGAAGPARARGRHRGG
jgi:hypothetical protein